MKNYRIFFIGNKSRDIGAEQAANIYKGLQGGVSIIAIDGDVFLAHQITSIERIKGQESKDLCEKHNVEKPPRIEDFLSSNQKLLS